MPTTVAYSDVKFLRKWIRSAIFGEKARGVKDAKMESKLTNVANSVFRDMAVLDQASIRSNIRPAVVDDDLFHIIRELAKARWKNWTGTKNGSGSRKLQRSTIAKKLVASITNNRSPCCEHCFVPKKQRTQNTHKKQNKTKSTNKRKTKIARVAIAVTIVSNGGQSA